jgi:hypothetical protein
VISVGVRLTNARWRHEDLHNRYILTDRGGILIGEGFDEANHKSTRTDDVLTLLSPETAAELLERYCDAAGLAKQPSEVAELVQPIYAGGLSSPECSEAPRRFRADRRTAVDLRPGLALREGPGHRLGRQSVVKQNPWS